MNISLVIAIVAIDAPLIIVIQWHQCLLIVVIHLLVVMAAPIHNKSVLKALTLKQQIAIAIMPKITASFSIIGSLLILQHIVRSPKRHTICYHRLLLGLSSMDAISSIKSFCVSHTVLI